MRGISVAEFPGYSTRAPATLIDLAQHDVAAAAVLQQTDQALREYGHEPLTNNTARPKDALLAQSPLHLHVGAFAVSSALYAALEHRGHKADILLGHSDGEYAAMAAAGCLSAYDAVRLLCEREAAFAHQGVPGGMTALQASARRARQLCRATGDWTLAPSLFNAPGQTVISGRVAGLEAVEAAARACRIQTARLLSPHPHHHPLLAPAARYLDSAMRNVQFRAPRARLYSPTTLTFIESADAARSALIRSMTTPVQHIAAVRDLHEAWGATTFIEIAARPVLRDLTAACLPRGTTVTGPPHSLMLQSGSVR
ncbi:ACP S-malonyltransferase [Streptomyces sp. NPDC002577]